MSLENSSQFEQSGSDTKDYLGWLATSLFPVDALRGSIWGYISSLKVTVRNGIRLLTAALKIHAIACKYVYLGLFLLRGFRTSVMKRQPKITKIHLKDYGGK